MVVNDRRRFLCESGLASCVLPFLQLLGPAFASTAKASQIREERPSPPLEEEEIDQETLQFWTRAVRTPATRVPLKPATKKLPGDEPQTAELATLRNSKTPSSSPLGATFLSSKQENEPSFFFNDAESGFRPAHLLSADKLPRRGDMSMLLQVLECRPSASDYQRIAKADAGSLRIDVQQGQPLPDLEEPLAWTAIAALLSGSSRKTPEASGFNFDLGNAWGKTRRVPLPGGLGFWTWNFFFKEKESPWAKFIDFVRTAGHLAGPYMIGLPAIATTALRQVDGILGQIQAMKRSRWVFQSRDFEIYGTRDSKDKVGPRAIQLRTGSYIIVPTHQTDQFQEMMKELTLVDGKLVPKETPPGRVTRVAEATLPDVSYLTLHVSARNREVCKCPPNRTRPPADEGGSGTRG